MALINDSMDDDVFATQKEDDPMDAACESPAAIAIQPFIEELEKSATSQRIARSKMQHKGKDESPTLKRSIHKIMMESGSEDESQPKKSEELMTAIVNETIKRRRTLEEQQNALIPDEDTMQRQVTEVLVPLPAPPPLPNTGSVATEASEMETEPMIASALVKKKFGRPPKKAVGAVAPIESPENSDDDTTQDMDSGRELGEKASTNSKKKPAAPKKKAATKAATKKKAPSKSRDLEAKAKTVSTSEMDVDIAETSTSNGGRSKRKAACKAMEATQKMMTVLPALERDFDIQEAPQYLHASRQTPKKAEFEGEALENQEANVGSEDELVAKEVSIPKSCSKESREDPSADASLDAPPETEEISGPAAKSRKRTIGLGRPKSGSSVVKEKSTGDEPAGDDGEPEKGLKESRGRGTTKRKSVTFDKGPLEEVDTTEDPLQVNENALLSSKNTKAPTTYKKRLLAQRATISHTTKDAGDKIDGTSDVAGGPSGVEESEGAKKEISEPEAEVGSKVKVNKKTEKLKLPLSEQETMDNGLSERRKQTVKVMFTGGRDIAMEKKVGSWRVLSDTVLIICR